jgi:hypothetical protein
MSALEGITATDLRASYEPPSRNIDSTACTTPKQVSSPVARSRSCHSNLLPCSSFVRCGGSVAVSAFGRFDAQRAPRAVLRPRYHAGERPIDLSSICCKQHNTISATRAHGRTARIQTARLAMRTKLTRLGNLDPPSSLNHQVRSRSAHKRSPKNRDAACATELDQEFLTGQNCDRTRPLRRISIVLSGGAQRIHE